MIFEGQYLTYLEYKQFVEDLGGSPIEEMPFNLLEFESRKQIDLRTQRRLIGIDDIPQEVKLCDYHLIEKINSYAEATSSIGGNVASESTDGYSISYITANQIQEIVKSKNSELQDIMLNDLYGVIVNGEHIIYNGAI